jgi:hypothetical protein
MRVRGTSVAILWRSRGSASRWLQASLELPGLSTNHYNRPANCNDYDAEHKRAEPEPCSIVLHAPEHPGLWEPLAILARQSAEVPDDGHAKQADGYAANQGDDSIDL